jgi:hypothetical protein
MNDMLHPEKTKKHFITNPKNKFKPLAIFPPQVLLIVNVLINERYKLR